VGTLGQDLLLRWHPSPCIVTCLTTRKLPNKLMQSIEPIDYCQLEQDICILFRRTEISDAAMHILKSRSLLISIMVLCNLPTCLGYQIKSVDKNGLPAVTQLLPILLPLVSKYVMMILCNLASYELLQDYVSRI
jgi:hypothetical protein